MTDSSGLLISKDFIVPIAKMLSMKRQKNGTYAVYQDSGCTYISEQSYQEMMENILLTAKHKEEVDMLKKRIKTLERHISLMPGGSEYLVFEHDFGQKAEEQKI